MAAVSVQHLAKSYGLKRAVDDVSFEVDRGEVFALLGPNGAGKTTTIEILEGFRARSEGRVETLGVDPASPQTQRWLRSHVGVVLQELAVEPFYSVRQVLDPQCRLLPVPPSGRRGHRAGWSLREGRRPGEDPLGGPATPTRCGPRHRRPPGVPLSGRADHRPRPLRPAVTRGTWSAKLAAEGTTVLLTTHYMDEVEALADQVAVHVQRPDRGDRYPFSSLGGRDSGAVTIRFCSARRGRPDLIYPFPSSTAGRWH